MRSIRRSSLTYLMLLLGLAIAGVGVLVDRFARAAIRAREDAETERIEQIFTLRWEAEVQRRDQAYRDRRREVEAKFDVQLRNEANILSRQARSKVWALLNPGRPPGKDRDPPGKERDPGSGPVFRAAEEDAKEFIPPKPRFLPPSSALAAVGGSAAATSASDPGVRNTLWLAYELPRTLPRIQEMLEKSYEDDQHPEFFQVQVVMVEPGQPDRTVAVVRPDRVPEDLPLDVAAVGKDPNFEREYDDIEIPGHGSFRRLVMPVSVPSLYPYLMGFRLPSPPGLQPGSGGWPGPGGRLRYDLVLRIYFHYARPRSDLAHQLAEEKRSLDAQFARREDERQDRDAQVAGVRAESRAELAKLRTRLGLIGAVTFVALLAGGWVVVGRGLRPVGRLSDAVSRVSERDFSLPHDGKDLPVELAPIHARLTQTLDLLRRAFSREKQAVADISHELRTPIAALMATLDVALRKPRSPEQYRATLEECRVISAQLGQLVERIMTLASLDAGNDRTLVSRTDAAELAAGCAAVIRPLAAANGLALTTRVDDFLDLDTDPGKLREVLMNLLHNAVEYNRPGGTIELVARRDGAAAVFEVQDSGIGMPAEVREKIFERFYRADPSRHATGVHAGLGLAIVKEYVARLGGGLSVDSAPGAGSTFRVTLPAAPAEPVPDAVAEPAAAP
ncbi:MAG: hypothetical protein C0501_13195 [Isosphaera sp.]|nr:hypothetical protein [Isosphaera sp.]